MWGVDASDVDVLLWTVCDAMQSIPIQPNRLFRLVILKIYDRKNTSGDILSSDLTSASSWTRSTRQDGDIFVFALGDMDCWRMFEGFHLILRMPWIILLDLWLMDCLIERQAGSANFRPIVCTDKDMNDEWWQASQTKTGSWRWTHHSVLCGPVPYRGSKKAYSANRINWSRLTRKGRWHDQKFNIHLFWLLTYSGMFDLWILCDLCTIPSVAVT